MTSNAIPAAPAIVPALITTGAVRFVSRLTPSPALFVELAESKKYCEPLELRMSIAGPPVAEIVSVPAESTVTVFELAMSRAAVAPDVVCSERSVPAPSPSTGWPVVLLSRIAPVPEPVTVMSFQRLVSRLVLAASSAFAPVVAIVFVAVFANSTRSALLIRTPIAVALPPLVTVTPVKRLTPVVPSISMPGCVPAVPVSVTLTFCTVTVSVPAPPLMPPPVPDGSTSTPSTSTFDASTTTSSLDAVSVGCAPEVPGCSGDVGSGPPPSGSSDSGRLSPISRSFAFIA